MTIIDEQLINNLLFKRAKPDLARIKDILSKAALKKGLNLDEVADLLLIDDPKLLEKVFKVAAAIKQEIYGERLVFFAPLYISNHCVNDCCYCGFHSKNKSLMRTKLGIEEIKAQVKSILDMGHKRVLLECGESPESTIDYVVNAIKAIYEVRGSDGQSNIRRINVNIAATTEEDYKKLKSAQIGTYQLFQETYHRETYAKLHKGPKADYDRQVTAHERAFAGGIDDFGIGVLFGLYDYRFEVLALIQHAQYLEDKLGVGPHTISVPRFRLADSVGYKPEHEVSDADFLKLIAILRLAVPYTGMIISTRETPAVRKQAFKLGISQSSAGSKTSPGGYSTKHNEQFKLSDERSLEEVIDSIVDQELLPSFCTACYRLGRTGHDFMGLAKDGHIHEFCRPNGLLTFMEYLQDYASPRVKEKGEKLITKYAEMIDDQKMKEETKAKLAQIKSGIRDLYF
ncbi:MAG: [FeFe] hydrogenase H-cluster radical SAM maturase HydG [bacterium]